MAPIDDDDDGKELAVLLSKPDQDSIVKEMARSKPDPKSTIESVFATSVNGLAHPVSPNEEQMMQLFTQAPLNNAYNLASCNQIQYPLDVATVLQGISILVKRHDILRSTWHMGESTVPVRRIHNKNQGDVSVYYVDKITTPMKIMAMDNDKPHQLGVTSARFIVCAVRNDRRKLDGEVAPFVGVNLHHVVADADGLNACLGELDLIFSYLFRGFSEAAIMEKLPVLTVQFSDYAYWQQSLQARGLLRQDLAVWFSSITASCPPMILDLPLDYPRQRIFIAVGGAVKVRIDQELIAPVLEKIATTPYSLVFCNFTIALSRLTGQSRVNVAIPYGTRANPSLYPLIGSFLNMLPATFEYLPSESYGAVLDRCSAIQLSARKYALAPYLTIVGMLRSFYNPTFDPSRNPVYQSMVDMVPNGTEEDGGGLGGVLDIFAFAQAPGGTMRLCEVGYNSTLFSKTTAQRMLMQIKSITYITAFQATQGAHMLHSKPLPAYLPTVEESHAAPSKSSLGSFPLKIYGNSDDAKDEECTVSLVSGFGFKGTPDEYDFYRRSLKFAQHSGVMPTTDIGHPKFGPQYQVPPKPPKKKNQPQVEIVLPQPTLDDSYQKVSVEPNLEWSPADSESLAKDSVQMLEGVIESYDAKHGFGLIKCNSINEDIPFFKMGVPIKNRPTKKQTRALRGLNVVFSYYNGGGGQSYATGLRFLDE